MVPALAGQGVRAARTLVDCAHPRNHRDGSAEGAAEPSVVVAVAQLRARRVRIAPCAPSICNAGGQTMEAIAYLRTSSASNVGLDKDSDRRQRAAIAAYAAAHKIKIVAEFYDAAVSGSDPI